MARIMVQMTIKDEDFKAGWKSDKAELAGSIRATLHELNGDDGSVYVPAITGVKVGSGRDSETAHAAALDTLCRETHHDMVITDSREVAAGVWVVFLSDHDNGQTITVTVAPSRNDHETLVCTWWDDETTLHVTKTQDVPTLRLA